MDEQTNSVLIEFLDSETKFNYLNYYYQKMLLETDDEVYALIARDWPGKKPRAALLRLALALFAAAVGAGCFVCFNVLGRNLEYALTFVASPKQETARVNILNVWD